MRGIVVGVLSAIVTALMLMPCSMAASSTGPIADRQGDLGLVGYVVGTGEPVARWQANTPVGKAGYLDVKSASLTVEGDLVTAEMDVWSPWTQDSRLPHGVKAVWWEWRFYKEVGYLLADYMIVVQWDGAELRAYVSSGEGAAEPFLVPIDADVGGTITAEVGGSTGALIQDAHYWIYETRIWTITPLTPPDFRLYGGWFAVDVPDPPWSTVYLPYLPMP